MQRLPMIRLTRQNGVVVVHADKEASEFQEQNLAIFLLIPSNKCNIGDKIIIKDSTLEDVRVEWRLRLTPKLRMMIGMRRSPIGHY